MSTSTVARCTARSIAPYRAVGTDLIGLTLDLWEATERVARGLDMTARDRRALTDGRLAVTNQRQMIEYVQAQATSSRNETRPVLALSDSGEMLELAWQAAEILDFDLPESIEGAEQLVRSLDQIADGDQEVATQLLPLFERVALLARLRTD